MAHYAYKCACYDIDYPKFQQLVKQFEEQEGRESDGDSNYDGDNWYIMEMWIRELRAENERLRASPASAPEVASLLGRWERRAQEALPADAMLINRHIRELRESIAAAPTPPVSEDRKDAERYRALKTGDFAVDQFVSASYGWKAIPTEELDQAIDAAMYGEVK